MFELFVMVTVFAFALYLLMIAVELIRTYVESRNRRGREGRADNLPPRDD